MELEELKSKWKKYNTETYNNEDAGNLIIITHKSWIKRNIVALEGILSVIVSISLIFTLFKQKTDLIGSKNLIIHICWFIISIYTLVKGIYTLIFFIDINKLDMESSKFLRNNLKNQLYFVYEKLTWLWFLIPIIIITLPFIVKQFLIISQKTIIIYSLIISVFYLITLLIFSKILLKKKHNIISKIKKIELSVS